MIYKTPQFTLDTRTLTVRNSKGEEVKVFNKDYELLCFLCEQNRACSVTEILDHVWDRNEMYASNLVAASVANIRKSLDKDAITTIRGAYLVETVEKVDDNIETLSVDNFSFPLYQKYIFIGLLSAFSFIVFSFLFIAFLQQSPLIVSDIHVNPKDNDNEHLEEEWIVFKNISRNEVDLRAWSVSDEAGHSYVFYGDRKILPGEEIKLVTGVCTNNESQVCWNRKEYAIWNNDSDTIILKDNKGKELLSYKYDFTQN